jgi:hypothetical protein
MPCVNWFGKELSSTSEVHNLKGEKSGSKGLFMLQPQLDLKQNLQIIKECQSEGKFE